MEIITTATIEKFCKDCSDLAEALKFLSSVDALTPSALAAFDDSAAACENFLEVYRKYRKF